MWFRIILTTITILCTFSRVLHANNQTTHAKDIICILLMAGLNKEDLDEGARQTLMAHNVDVENMDMEEMHKKCYSEKQLNNTTEVAESHTTKTETTRNPDTTPHQYTISNPILTNPGANTIEPNTSTTKLLDLTKINTFNTMINETIEVIRGSTTESTKLKNDEEQSIVVKADENKIINFQYMKDVWAMFSKQYLIESTTELTTVITTTTLNTPKTTKPTGTIKQKISSKEIEKFFGYYLPNLENKEQIKKLREVTTVTYNLLNLTTEKNLANEKENTTKSNKIEEKIQTDLSEGKSQDILSIINKLLINNMQIRENVTKFEPKEKYEIKKDSFNANKVPEKQIETATMMISSNVIQDIVDKVKNIVIKDLTNNSSTAENTTVKPTSTTFKEDDKLLKEFKQLFKDFRKEKMKDGKYEFSQRKKIIIQSPNFTTSMSLNKNIKYPISANEDIKHNATKKSKSVPNILQTNQLEIPPLFTLDPNPQVIRNIIVPSTTQTEQTNKNFIEKHTNKYQTKVNNYNDIKIDENYPKITEITHKVYGFQRHPTITANIASKFNIEKQYNSEIYSMPEMTKLNKMFNTINREQVEIPIYTPSEKRSYDDTQESFNEYSKPNNRRNNDQQHYYDRNQNTHPYSGRTIKTNERDYYYRNEPQKSERYSKIISEDIIDSTNNFYDRHKQSEPELHAEVDIENNYGYNYERNKPKHGDRFPEVRNNGRNNNGYLTNSQKVSQHRNEPRNVYPEHTNIREINKIKVNTNRKTDVKRPRNLEFSEPIIKRRLNRLRPKNLEQSSFKGNIFGNNFRTSKGGAKEIIKTIDKAIDSYKNTNGRNIIPLRGEKNSRQSYNDTHFREFLNTQQKVNDILDSILNMKPSHGHITSVEAI